MGPSTSQHGPRGATSWICKCHHRDIRCSHGCRLVHMDLRGLGCHCADWHCSGCIQPHTAREACNRGEPPSWHCSTTPGQICQHQQHLSRWHVWHATECHSNERIPDQLRGFTCVLCSVRLFRLSSLSSDKAYPAHKIAGLQGADCNGLSTAQGCRTLSSDRSVLSSSYTQACSPCCSSDVATELYTSMIYTHLASPLRRWLLIMRYYSHENSWGFSLLKYLSGVMASNAA